MTGSEGRWAKGRMGEEEEGMRGRGIEGGEGAESRFWSEEFHSR